MVHDMLAIGRPEPEISEVDGPYVRVGLIGGEPDAQIVDFLANLEPPSIGSDLDVLLLINHLRRNGWIDVESAGKVLQRPPRETEAALGRLAGSRAGRDQLISAIKGTPPDRSTAYRLGDHARARLAAKSEHLTSPDGRTRLILDWAAKRGRVSTTEIADITGLSVPYAGSLLTALEEQGLLIPGRSNKAGRGFFYLPAAEGG
jgi:ATP-dependent DNA helicase RecG